MSRAGILVFARKQEESDKMMTMISCETLDNRGLLHLGESLKGSKSLESLTLDFCR